MTTELLSYDVTIDAPIDIVFDLLTDADGLLQWIAVDARTDPRPGGMLTWTHANGQVVCGQYLELQRPERIVFSYGWEENDLVAPGSTRVEIELAEIRPGATHLQLTHRNLPVSEQSAHLEGWRYFLGEMATAARNRPERTVTP